MPSQLLLLLMLLLVPAGAANGSSKSGSLKLSKNDRRRLGTRFRSSS
jgi:hypothetical protein